MKDIIHNILLNILNCVLSRYVNMCLCKTRSLQRKDSLNGYLFAYFLLILLHYVLCYKSEGRWFNSRWCHWNFSLA